MPEQPNERPRRSLFGRVADAPTLLGAGCRFEGTLTAEGPVSIAGTVVGNATVRGTLSMAEGSLWTGDVHAENCIVAGTVTGDLTIDGKLQIAHSAVIRGTVRAQSLAIAHGAVVEGELIVSGAQPILRFEEKRGLPDES